MPNRTAQQEREHERPQGSKSPENLPDPERLPELVLYSHSGLFYWWPVWATGLTMAAVTYFRGGLIELDSVRDEYVHRSSAPGMTFVLVTLMVILFTNVKMRGIYSVVFILILLTLGMLLAWLGWWDNILSVVPQLSIHMNMGFYLFFSSALAVMWVVQFFVIDRLTFWRIRPGQLTEEHVIGGGEESYDVRGMLFEQHGDDLFRHTILGLGAADLRLTTTGARKAIIDVPNVMFATRKIQAIQRLVAVKPDDLLGEPI